MSRGPSQRQLRVGEQVRHALAELIARGEIRDPLVESVVVSVNEVSMSPDLRIATAFVTPLAVEDGEAVAAALQGHAKYIRGRLAPALRQMKYMPEIRFRLDTSFGNFEKIDRLLRSPEVSRDLGSDKEDEED